MKTLIRSLTVVVVIGWLATVAKAPPIVATLADGNATAEFGLSSSAGMYDWKVDGVDHMSQQWFWYRIGNEQTDREYSIDTLDLGNWFTTNTNFDMRDDTLFVPYVDPGNTFTIECRFMLAGGTDGSGTSDIGESIKIVNIGAETLDFHFFQYCDFDLNDTLVDERVEITGGNTANQQDIGCTIAETVESPKASHYEVGIFSDTLDDLEDNGPTTLGDVAGPLFDDNLTWAFQWDFTLAPGDSFLISKDKLVVPEPATLALLVGGGGILALRKRRRR